MDLNQFKEELEENERKIKALRFQFETMKKQNRNVPGIDFEKEERVVLDAENWLKGGWEAYRLMRDHPNDPSTVDALLDISSGSDPTGDLN